jgi:hypothetical protein
MQHAGVRGRLNWQTSRETASCDCDAQAKRTVQLNASFQAALLLLVLYCDCASSLDLLPPRPHSCPFLYQRNVLTATIAIYKQTRARVRQCSPHRMRRIYIQSSTYSHKGNACYADALADPSHLHTVIKGSKPATTVYQCMLKPLSGQH